MIVPELGIKRLTTDDVRAFTLDNMVENNLIDLDLMWSEDEIMNAMRRCAMHYNSIPPLGQNLSTDPFFLPTSYVHLLGTTYQLYLSTLQKYQRNDLSYTVGGVTATLNEKRIGHFTQMLAMLRDEFVGLAKEAKEITNLNNAFGTVG